MKYIQSENALKVNGHYAQAVEHGGTVFVSGILPFSDTTGEFVNGTVEEQAKQIFINLDSILKAAGTDRSHVLKATVYIPDINLWSPVNQVYAEYFGDHRPARSIVPVGPLHFGAKMELDVIASI